jgi:hypothetical protein
MRHFYIILIFLLIAGKSFADYEPTPLPELVIKSDLIIEGEIVSLDSLTFTLKVSDCIKGDSTTTLIQVQKFEDWTCANRITKYEKGQKEIVFLIQNRKTQKLRLMGAADEGELLIQNDSITYEDIYWNPGSGYSELDYFGHTVRGWRYSLKEFKRAILFYISEFPLLQKEYQTEYKITNRLGDNEAYKRMIKESLSLEFMLILLDKR